ncbi:MAG: sulfatase-like hydrolase/transferase [Xenococcaceae cyanobacterium]
MTKCWNTKIDFQVLRTTIARVLKTTIAMALLMLLFSQAAQAVVYDAPYEKLAARKAAEWAQDDREVNAKLQDLENRFGKKPNIIYILTDDVGWGELGWQGGGKHRGTPSAELDGMAYDGMRFWSAYSEPSCTPSRVAINTGRHPVRTGLLSVLWPGQADGLSSEEVTLAEILSQAGYDTAMWGKWHLGEGDNQALKGMFLRFSV